MSEEKRKQPAVGDRGQRYEIWCDDEDGKPMQMGWSNNPESMKQAVEKHPCWKNHRAVDRLGAAAVKSESAPDADRPRSCPAHGWPSLRWTAELPKRRGWWWVRVPGMPMRPIEVENWHGSLNAFDGHEWRALNNSGNYWKGAEWAGPLPKPLEASDEEPTANDQALRPLGGRE